MPAPRPWLTVKRGSFRFVILVGEQAIKLPRLLRHPVKAMRCNRWEREMWNRWQRKYEWQHLCPVLWADRWGFVVVMRRATTEVSEEELAAFVEQYDPYPDITCEWDKPSDWRRLEGRIVSLDYGLWDEDTVLKQRAYYCRTAKR